jgi:hypothetical protein
MVRSLRSLSVLITKHRGASGLDWQMTNAALRTFASRNRIPFHFRRVSRSWPTVSGGAVLPRSDASQAVF